MNFWTILGYAAVIGVLYAILLITIVVWFSKILDEIKSQAAEQRAIRNAHIKMGLNSNYGKMIDVNSLYPAGWMHQPMTKDEAFISGMNMSDPTQMIGRNVIAKYGNNSGIHGSGRVVSYTDKPTYTIARGDGTRFSWIAELVAPISQRD